MKFSLAILLATVSLIIGCAAQQTEEQALASLRAVTSSGKLPAEAFAADLETRFANKKTGALAKLLRARIRFETGDFAGAAAMLNSPIFKQRTELADYALWLRGKALQQSGDHAQALAVLSELIRDHADSIRLRDAKLLWATSAIAAGRAVEVPPMLVEMSEKGDGEALLATAKAYEAQGSQAEAVRYFRRTFFQGAGSAAAKEAEAKLTALGQPLAPQSAEEQLARADTVAATKNFADAVTAYSNLASSFPAAMTTSVQLRRLTAMAAIGRMTEAPFAFNAIPASAKEREDANRQFVLGYAKARMWPQARAAADAMKAAFPNGSLVAKTLIDAGLAAREAKNRTDEGYFFNTAVAAFPNAVEVATAQFEAAWFQHEQGNYALSSQQFIEHLARYADKDSSNRGKAGYWAARDSERAGKIAEACALYEGVIYRYSANWYGHLAMGRLSTLKNNGQCVGPQPASLPVVAKAIANLKTVTVAAETAREKELNRAEKSDELSTIGLFDWAIDELNEARKTAPTSPKINLALARHYRWKGDNTSALIAMQKPYPDYAQMFPEEMGQEEWSFFYPLSNWAEIKKWAAARGLDKHQVAGFIRQETVFTANASSPAKAYGFMQLLLPTAQSVARKYGASAVPRSPAELFEPNLNIELGTAYMKDQFAKFGRVEYVAIAYNAGPGRVAPWRATLPAEMDEFVEEIPFRETKQYVQGIIRNTAQYRRLYDDNGNFRSNVGTKPLRGELETKPRDQFTAENPEVVIDEDGPQ